MFQGMGMFGGPGDPFQQMHQHMQQMMNFGMGMGMGMPPMQQQWRGQRDRAAEPQVYEVGPDDAEGVRSSSQPIVEEPSSEGEEDHSGQRHTRHTRRRVSPPQQQQQQQQQVGPLGSMGMGMGMGFPFAGFGAMPTGGASYSYSSSSYSSSGPNGTSYQATNTSRQGPGGVRESHSTYYDGRTGQRQIRLSRGIGDRERTLTRIRDATGREDADEILKNMTQEEADRFDEEWVAEAEQQLLRNPGTTARLGAGAGRRAAAAAASRPPLMLQHQHHHHQQQLGTGGSRGAGQYQQQAAQPGGGYSYAGSYANGAGHSHRTYGPGARSYSSTMHH